jgi:hypothetical protein
VKKSSRKQRQTDGKHERKARKIRGWVQLSHQMNNPAEHEAEGTVKSKKQSQPMNFRG